METEVVRQLIVVTSLVDVATCRAELDAVRAIRGVVDARELVVMERLEELAQVDPTVFPEGEVAAAAKTSLSKAVRAARRKQTVGAVPELGEALQMGRTTGDRVDVVAAATAGLSKAEHERFAAHGDAVAKAAAQQTDGEFRRTVDRYVRWARSDDGLDRLQRQRRAARLRWWVDSDGLWCMHGRFDPATGARLEGRLRNEVERIFHGPAADSMPETTPNDPFERQQHLAAHALQSLVLGRVEGVHGEAGEQDEQGEQGGGTSTRRWAPSSVPDVSVLIDYETIVTGHGHANSVCEVGLAATGLPVETIRRWGCIGTVTPVVVAADGVRIALGRTTRLANRAQRRALRALYRTCALCDVPFDHCQIHHVSWFRLQGLTDIGNLMPLCGRHHHLAHEGGWHLRLHADRTLTITKPGGVVSTHGPPRVRAA